MGECVFHRKFGPCPQWCNFVINQALMSSLVKCAGNKQTKNQKQHLPLPRRIRTWIPSTLLGRLVTSANCAREGRKGNAWALRHFCYLCGPSNPALFTRLRCALVRDSSQVCFETFDLGRTQSGGPAVAPVNQRKTPAPQRSTHPTAHVPSARASFLLRPSRL